MAKPKTRKELADEMRLTPDQIRQIEKTAMRKAREMLEYSGVGRDLLDALDDLIAGD